MLEQIKQYLKDHDFNDTIILENPSYETAIIGISENEELVYDFDLMVEYLVKNESMSHDDAVDFICANTIRAIPYFKGVKPIIMNHIEF